MAAALKDVFYLDDPQDGASTHLLGEIGVTLHRKGGAAAEAGGAAALSAAGLAPAAAPSAAVSLAAEHSFPTPCGYTVAGGSCLVDVRDSVDAWVRLVLHDGDAVALAAGVHHRVPARGTPVVVMPVFPADADRHSRMTTVVFPRPAEEIGAAAWGAPAVYLPAGAPDVAASLALRFAPGSAEEAAANVPHFQVPGTPHTRDVVVDLCDSFYHLGWVTGTGGSISIRHGNRIFMAPSGVQKERMQRQDMYCLDTAGAAVYAPAPLPGKPRLKLSQCAPLFQHAFSLRKAGACIHTHDISAVMTTLQNGTEFSVTHQEMIKGVAGHGFLDTCTVPIIENTPHECDLADSLEEAMRRCVPAAGVRAGWGGRGGPVAESSAR
jgi:ribulose-5-phosphate 4-epimerase/fuculose-1-phosphate aldolase